jgi:glucose-6-phosphate isomerase
VDLCAHPPLDPCELTQLAADIQAEGLDAVVLIGQGGSSQASMTITKLNEGDTSAVAPIPAFRTMDSLSPVFVDHILSSSDPARTLYLVSSKSGSTIEPLMLEHVTWHHATEPLGDQAAGQRFIAITDPGSQLEQLARVKGYRTVLNSPADVGGRFSALTVFSLFPAALVGIDIEQILLQVAPVEALCQSDDDKNPALTLACFLYACYQAGRDKFSLLLPPEGQVFGLWVEQLVAESLGKDGRGILPNVEVDAAILTEPRDDRSVISYGVGESVGFAEALEHLDPSIPALHFTMNSIKELFEQFVIWEYAVVLLGVLLNTNPFGQPDVELTKNIVRQHLEKTNGRAVGSADNSPEEGKGVGSGRSPGLAPDADLRDLLTSITPGDYFSLNAFLPFRGAGRREALERMRHRVASHLGVASCLEIGPRYLHSTGQLQKGGPNTGVFLILSADEKHDIAIPGKPFTLGELATIQAQADYEALSSRGRRVLHVHLPDNDPETLSDFADQFCDLL